MSGPWDNSPEYKVLEAPKARKTRKSDALCLIVGGELLYGAWGFATGHVESFVYCSFIIAIFTACSWVLGWLVVSVIGDIVRLLRKMRP